MKEYQNPILAFFCEHPVGPDPSFWELRFEIGYRMIVAPYFLLP